MTRPETARAPSQVSAGSGVVWWLVSANIAVIALIAVLLAVTLSASRSAHRQRAFDAVDSLARGLERIILAEVERVDLALRLLALQAETPQPVRLPQGPSDLRTLIPEAKRLRVLQGSASEAPWLAAARAAPAGGLVVSGPRQVAGTERWVLDFARRLGGPDGTGTDLVVAELDVDHFDRLFSGIELGGQSAITLRMADLALVTRITDPPTPRSGLGDARVSDQLQAALLSQPRGGVFQAETVIDGIERASAYRRVGDLPMIVLVGLATTDYLATWRNEAGLALGLALLAACVLAGASGLGYRAWRRGDASRRELDRERQRLRALLITASDGVHVIDRNGMLVEFSDAFATLLGRSREALRGVHVSSWEARYPREQVERVLRGFRVGERLDFSSIYRRADGTTLDVDVTAVGVRLDDRELFYLAARDVTEKRRSLAALQASEAFLDRTGRIAGVGGWELDLPAGRIQLTGQALHLLDLAPDAVPSLRGCLRLFRQEDRRRLAQAVLRSRLDGQPWDLELPATTRSGRAIWLRCFAEPEVRNGPAHRMIGAVQDVSERQARTAELRREQALRAELEQQGREQSRMLRERGEMLDVLAHEVRQPLNNASAALQSAASALYEVGEQVAKPRLLRAQSVLGNVMARIDNTLAVAALLARPGPIEREDTDIDTLVAVSIADMSAADRRRVQVLRETAARTASMDMSLMRLALRNLLSNAMKYSPPGSPVTLRMADSEVPLGLIIDVSDQGGGVESGLQPRLFERGARGTAPAPGMSQGLGLYIVRRVMELHGGQAQLVATGPAGTTMRLLVVDAPDE